MFRALLLPSTAPADSPLGFFVQLLQIEFFVFFFITLFLCTSILVSSRCHQVHHHKIGVVVLSLLLSLILLQDSWPFALLQGLIVGLVALYCIPGFQYAFEELDLNRYEEVIDAREASEAKEYDSKELDQSLASFASSGSFASSNQKDLEKNLSKYDDLVDDPIAPDEQI